jgi:hypothetical protein
VTSYGGFLCEISLFLSELEFGGHILVRIPSIKRIKLCSGNRVVSCTLQSVSVPKLRGHGNLAYFS